jgi:hypothetical protein
LNKEHIKEVNKMYYRNHKEEKKEYDKKYREENKEHINNLIGYYNNRFKHLKYNKFNYFTSKENV